MNNKCSFCDQDFDSFRGYVPNIGEVCKFYYNYLLFELNKMHLIRSKKITRAQSTVFIHF